MEKKLTRGTVVFIWSLLGFSLLNLVAGLMMIASPKQTFPFLSELGSFFYYLDGWVSIAIGFVASVYLLKRKEWARKLLLIYVAVGLLAMVSVHVPFIYHPKYKLQVSVFEQKVAEKWQRGFVGGMRAAIRDSKQAFNEEDIKRITEESLPEKNAYVAKQKKAYAFRLSIFYVILYGGLAFYNVMLFFFFTRPKVKEQFK